MNVVRALGESGLSDAEGFSYEEAAAGKKTESAQLSLVILGEQVVLERMLAEMGLSREDVQKNPDFRNKRNQKAMDLERRYGGAMRVAVETEQGSVFDYMQGLATSATVENSLDQINRLLNAINQIIERRGYNMPSRAREFLAETLINSFKGSSNEAVIPKQLLVSDEAIFDLIENDLGNLLRIFSHTYHQIEGLVGTYFVGAGLTRNAATEGSIAQDIVSDTIGYQALIENARSHGDAGIQTLINVHLHAIQVESQKEVLLLLSAKQHRAVSA